jgi:DNA-binding transcriptional regulator YdaS (Cro superfamily)
MDIEEQKRVALEQAIASAGSITELTKRLGIKDIAVVSQWRQRGQVPAKWAFPVSEVTGVPCHLLRPDVFPRKVAA